MQLQGLLGASKLVPVASTIEKKKKKHKGAADHAREVEDDYLEDLEDMERLIAAKNAALVEKDAVIEKAISMLIAGGLSEKDARAKLLG
jgi:hypothetical protein